jgi:hypothetical protein
MKSLQTAAFPQRLRVFSEINFFIVLFLVLFFTSQMSTAAQESFGFDDPGGFGFSDSSSISLNIGGEVKAELTGFYDDFGSAEKMKSILPGDIFLGKLNFSASASLADAVINLNLRPVFDGTSPVEIDEAFARAFFGPMTVEGGIRKLFWGRADSFGPLDVINPLDYSDLTKLSDPQSIKIARPMIHASYTIGSLSKLEAVFVPWFQGHRFARSGRWAPGQMIDLAPDLVGGMKNAMTGIDPGLAVFFPSLDDWQNNFDIDRYYWDQNPTLNYAQAGTRFTAAIGSSDIGIQYYFGRLPRPSVNIGIGEYVMGLLGNSPQSDPDKISILVDYNYYHQIGIDFARVIAGFNLRAEAGANITGDLDGTDGSVCNPSIVWSLGFDRDIFAGAKLNLQGTGKLRLFHGKLGESPLEDCEAGSDLSSTRMTGIVSRKFLRDELELKASCLWGIEEKDFLLMPALTWSRNDLSVEFSVGFFGGDKKGELGQYRDNGFFKIGLLYCF